jgi:hypothetical protein
MLPLDKDSPRRQVKDHFFHRMGILIVHSHSFWIEECTNNILKSGHSFIQRIHPSIFEVYLDDWTIYSLLEDHVEVLKVMLERCRQCHISLNTKKRIFSTPFWILLSHIVCKQGLLLDPAKIVVIVNLPPPKLVR